MVNQLETEYELDLIRRGRKQLRKQLDEKVDKNYYSIQSQAGLSFIDM